MIECVPNLSEGRRAEVILALAATIRAVPHAWLLDVHSDVDHNRSVFTIAGSSAAVSEAAFRLAEQAARTIDLRQHAGTHPRIGALDVLPFVPLGNTPMSHCVDVARQVGQRIAEELGLPVYFYGEAAQRAERRKLGEIRRGQYEGLCQTIGADPLRAPDLGPRHMGPAGAVAVGARGILIAFNVHLRADLAVARAIARAVRESSGGLPGVQALGLATSHPGLVQVSMNLTDPERTPPHIVVDAVRQEARSRGVAVADSELVGLMPASSMVAAAAQQLGLPTLARSQVIDLAVADAAAND